MPNFSWNRIFVGVALLLGLLASQPTAFAQDLPEALRNAPSAARWHTNDHDFTSEIDQAKAMLKNKEAGFTVEDVVGKVKKGKKTITKVVGHKIGDYHILLAVKHKDRKEIEVISIDRNDHTSNGYKIDWDKMNGVNTKFVLSHPDGYTVLAIKRVVRSGKTFREVIYTPFTADIDTPTMRQLGFIYLKEVLDRAQKDLVAKKVDSEAAPDKNLTEVVPLKVAMTLSIIEHIDPARYEDEDIKGLVDEFLVIMAANRGSAYAYAVSYTGARGLFQFMPETYQSLVDGYPEAGLIDGFAVGANDHVNAAKASLLLFDSDLSQVPTDERTELLKDPTRMAEYLAVAYNSGALRAKCAYLKIGSAERCKRHSKLFKETKTYLEKERDVAKFFP